MTAIAYRGRASGEYPLSLADVRLRSGVGFGDAPTQDVLDLANVDPVESAQAVYDPATQRIAGEGAPVKVGAVWRQTWVIEDIGDPVPLAPVKPELRAAALGLVVLDGDFVGAQSGYNLGGAFYDGPGQYLLFWNDAIAEPYEPLLFTSGNITMEAIATDAYSMLIEARQNGELADPSKFSVQVYQR